MELGQLCSNAAKSVFFRSQLNTTPIQTPLHLPTQPAQIPSHPVTGTWERKKTKTTKPTHIHKHIIKQTFLTTKTITPRHGNMRYRKTENNKQTHTSTTTNKQTRQNKTKQRQITNRKTKQTQTTNTTTYTPTHTLRHRGDSNPCGQSPMDF